MLEYFHIEAPKVTQLKENWYNLHGAIHEIVPNLKIFGYGGSTHAFFEQNGTVLGEAWSPYPYPNDDDFSKGLNQIVESLSEEYKDNPKLQIIAMTHIGPYDSMSSVDTRTYKKKNKIVRAGSKSLGDALNTMKEYTLFNVHGHTHWSQKRDEVHEVPIINPNWFFEGKYAEIYLEKDTDSELWKLEKIEYLEL